MHTGSALALAVGWHTNVSRWLARVRADQEGESSLGRGNGPISQGGDTVPPIDSLPLNDSSESAVIRPASPNDADAIGRIFLRARDAMRYLPRITDDDRPKLGGWITARHEVWVIERGGRVMGFAGLSQGWLDHLYMDPDSQSRGFGSMLLEHAKTLQPHGLRLWVFQKNIRARRFYEHHDFRLERTTDGSSNMEREPDALYSWQPEMSRSDPQHVSMAISKSPLLAR
jgi:GNAT superfamily N-acetyltransferase